MEQNKTLFRFVFEDRGTRSLVGEIIEETDFLYKVKAIKSKEQIVLGKRNIIKIQRLP